MNYFKNLRFDQLRIAFYILLLAIFYQFTQFDIYEVTAYCSCKICINKLEFRDGKFASNENVYFGGAAARRGIPFGTRIKLLPLNPRDQSAVKNIFQGRTDFVIEDRGFLIRGNKIDIYIPKWLGGHKAAQKWVIRRMRILFNRS